MLQWENEPNLGASGQAVHLQTPAVHQFTHVFGAIFINVQWLFHHISPEYGSFAIDSPWTGWGNAFSGWGGYTGTSPPRNTQHLCTTSPQNENCVQKPHFLQGGPKRSQKKITRALLGLVTLSDFSLVNFSTFLPSPMHLPRPLPKSVTGSPPSCY